MISAHRRARIAPLAILAATGLVAGCASLLGDFSSTNQGTGSEDGGPGAHDDGAVGTADAGADDTGTGPQPDARPGSDAASPFEAGSPDGAPVDASTGKDAGDAAPDQAAPWSPTVLDQAGELALWLEASSANLVISGGLVESWKDLSHNKNDASNSNNGPTVASGVVGGHDALNFASYGLTLAIPDATSIQFGNDQVYITAVARVASGSPYFFAKYTTGQSGAGPYYATGLLFFATRGLSDAGVSVLGPVVEVNNQAGDEVDWGNPAFEDGKFHIVSMRRTNGFTVALTVDDSAPETGSTGSFDLSEPGQSAFVGSVSFGSVHPVVNFDIAEILAVHSASSGVVADADVANVHAYLKQKYGL